MSEITVASLPVRLQKQVEHARTAIDRGNTEYAVNICREVLRQHPGCLAVRRLLRAAQIKVFRARNKFFAKTVGAMSGAPALVAAQALVKKNPEKALDAVERVLGTYPANLTALKILAQAAMTLHFYETAAFALEAVVESQPENRAVLVRLAEAYVSAGRSSEALTVVDGLLEKEPGNMDLQELAKRASVATSIRAGRWEMEGNSFRERLRDKDETITLEQSGKAMASEEMTGRVIEEAEKRLEAEPLSLGNYRTIIEGHRRLGNLGKALAWVEKARRIPVGSVDSSLERTEIDLRIAIAEEQAKARARQVSEEGGDPDADPETMRLRDELFERRIENLRNLASKYPNELSYRCDLGRLYEQSGQLDFAIQQFQFAQRSPKHRITALAHLGSCFLAKGLHDLAAEQFETAKTELPTFTEEKKEIVYQLAHCFELLGKSEEAAQEFKSIYSVDIGFRDVSEKIDAFYSKR